MNRIIVYLLLSASWAGAQERTDLSAAAHFARTGGDCAAVVPLEHYQSLPLPVKTSKGLRYRVMFYPAVPPDRAPGRIKLVYPPSAVSEFDAEGTKVTCRVSAGLPKSDPRAPLGPQATEKTAAMSLEAYRQREARLYAAIERAAKSFAAGKKDRKAAAEFLELYGEHAEPGLDDYYRALGRDFFRWAAASL